LKIYNTEYVTWVKELKKLIQKTQIKASLAVNKELIDYIGILENPFQKRIKEINGESLLLKNFQKIRKQNYQQLKR